MHAPSPSALRAASMRLPLLALLFTFCSFAVRASEVIPPAPVKHFNDYAGAVSPATAAQLNQKLEDFERQTSSQILVVVYPKMQSDSSIEDYTVRVAQSWKVGLKGKDNGALLFVFIQDRKMYIQVGYGLEGALPDALAKRIIENEIKPRFRNGDFNGGLTAGVNAILAATRRAVEESAVVPPGPIAPSTSPGTDWDTSGTGCPPPGPPSGTPSGRRPSIPRRRA